MNRKVRLLSMMLVGVFACGGDRLVRSDAGARGVQRKGGELLPASGGIMTLGSISRGQRVAFTQALEAGQTVACVDARKPKVEFAGHLEVVRLLGRSGEVQTIRAGSLWRAQPNLSEWRNWCELMGELRYGDLVRLVSDVDADGEFTFRVTLRAP